MIVLAAVSCTCVVPVCHASTVAATYAAAQSPDSDDEARLEVSVRDGVMTIVSSKALNIKIFSILGQLVTQRSIQPGVTRIKMPARGIYILKAGAITRRITV